MKPWVLIDVSYLAHRAYHTMGGLSHGDIPTAVIYGFFETLYTICTDRRINSNRIACFFDSRQSYRREVFPEYKIKRQKKELTEEEWAEKMLLRQQVNQLRLMLKDIGFPCYRQRGLESDDLIADASAQVDCRMEQGVIVTSDGDLYQCINRNINWYDPARDRYLTAVSFLFEEGIAPDMWCQVKQIGGCNTDNVPGVTGVAEKTAVKFLTGKLPVHHKTHAAITCNEGQKIVQRNWQLVVLPHHKTKRIALREPAYDVSKFFAWCIQLGIQSYVKEKKRAWQAFFEGRSLENRHEPRKRVKG